MIEVKNLSRSFGPIVAADNVSFNVKKGDVLGFLGPNGAGKTTVMRMLACFIRPDSGTASVHRWNLITRNTQMAVSGIYYWTVEDDSTGTVQVGKLVIIM